MMWFASFKMVVQTILLVEEYVTRFAAEGS